MESAAEKYEQPPPAYEETVPAEPASPPNERLRLDKSFIRTFLGMNIIANMALALLSIIIMAAGAEDYYWFNNFIYACTCVLFAFIAVFIIHLFRIHKAIKQIHWPLTLLINCGLWSFVMFVSSVMALAKAKYSHNTGTVSAAGVFGLITMGSIIAEGILHFNKYRETRHEGGGVWCCVFC